MYSCKDDRCVMKVNDLQAAFHMPAALIPKKDKDGEEKPQGLPPAAPRFVFPVEEYPACPTNWMHGSSKASSYWLPVRSGCGMWIDLNYAYQHSHHVAAVVSIQGVNPITGQQTTALRLEQYRDNCPVHGTAFGQERFCEQCGYKWDAQNYVCSNATPRGLLWIDGFRFADGVVRQYVFTKEMMKGVAAQIIDGVGKTDKPTENRVFAIGIAFYLSKKPKTVAPVAPECTPNDGSYTNWNANAAYSSGAIPMVPGAQQDMRGSGQHTNSNKNKRRYTMKGFPPSNTISPSVRITDKDLSFQEKLDAVKKGLGATNPDDIATFKRISIPLERKTAASQDEDFWLPTQDQTYPPLSNPADGTIRLKDSNDFIELAKGGVVRDVNIPSVINCCVPPLDQKAKLEQLKLQHMKDNPQLLGVPSDDAMSLNQLSDGSGNLDIFYTHQYDPVTGKEYNMETGDTVCDFDPLEYSRSAPRKPRVAIAPDDTMSPDEVGDELRNFSPEDIEREMEKLEITAGARIRQKIYADPEELDFWQDEPAGFIYINYVDLETAEKIMSAGQTQRAGGFMSALAGI